MRTLPSSRRARARGDYLGAHCALVGRLVSEDNASHVTFVVTRIAVALSAEQDESIIVTVHCPRALCDFAKFDKPPITVVDISKPKIISDCGRDIKAGAAVQVRPRTLIAKDVLPMICAEGAAIFPLSIAGSVTVVNLDPPAFKNRFA